MKTSFLKTLVAAIFICCNLNSNAQNSLTLQWGLFTPLNKNIHQEYQQKYNFSIGFLHPIKHTRLSAGFTYNHQRFDSKSNLNNEYQFSIYNYLLSGRYDIYAIDFLQLYAGIDLGLNRIKYESKSGIVDENQSYGFSGNAALGADLRISKHLVFGVNLQNQYFSNTEIQLQNNENAHHLFNLGGNLSICILFNKK